MNVGVAAGINDIAAPLTPRYRMPVAFCASE
jgi:hypothetical protein